MNKDELDKSQEFEIKYKIGLNEQKISLAKGKVLTLGRFDENDIYTGDADQSVSRIQLFIFVIGNSLIILDGWSFAGTKCIQSNCKKINLPKSIPQQRCIMRFNKNDTIRLRLGADKLEMVINPKECIVCMDKARIIRNKCGHFILCTKCYKDILSSSNPNCPLCRSTLNEPLSSSSQMLDNFQSYDGQR